MQAPIDANAISMVNLLSHNHDLRNSGLQFRLASVDEMSREDMERVIFDFSRSRPQGFEYSNSSFNIAGAIMEKISDKSWKDIVNTEVFAPLGMVNTTAFISQAVKRDFAYPYWQVGNEFERLPLKDDRVMQSAGGHVSTPIDLARWLIANMNQGRIGKEQLIPAAVVRRVHQDYAELDSEFFEFKRPAYQLGWYRGDYEGDTLVHHFGSYQGYMAHTSYMPAHDLGVVVLANELDYGAILPHLIAAYIYDFLLGKEGLEVKYDALTEGWKERYLQKKDRLEEQLHRKEQLIKRLTEEPIDWLYDPNDLVGTYYSPRIGSFEIELRDGELWTQYGVVGSKLLALQEGSFVGFWDFSGPKTPPVKLDIRYDQNNQVIGIDWEGRGFRRLANGYTSAQVNQDFNALRAELKKARSVAPNKQSKLVEDVLKQYFTSGAIGEGFINSLGYHYLRQEELHIALGLFQFNVEHF
ncbi:MAG: serine hydrolase domain-containing protein, partial [Bacteroidota bacterium]